MPAKIEKTSWSLKIESEHHHAGGRLTEGTGILVPVTINKVATIGFQQIGDTKGQSQLGAEFEKREVKIATQSDGKAVVYLPEKDGVAFFASDVQGTVDTAQ